MIMVNIEFLKQVQVFQGLNQKQLSEVVTCCEGAAFKSGAKIFAQGDDAVYLWIVEAGTVELRFEAAGGSASAGHTISTITEAGAFGWSSFASPNKYRLSAYCGNEPCNVIKVEREGLKALLDQDADMGYAVISNVATVVGTRFHEFQEEAARQKGQDLLGGW
jgi:signal-transduction protein with cAMP-binding, CBS, and nucleotidyltransferase domain